MTSHWRCRSPAAVTWAIAALLLLAALTLAACGSDGTASTPAPAPSVTPTPAASDVTGDQAVLEQYLEDLRPALEAHLKGVKAEEAADEAKLPTGEKHAAASAKFASARDIAVRIEAPEGLAEAHRKLVRYLTFEAKKLKALSRVFAEAAAFSITTDEFGKRLDKIYSAGNHGIDAGVDQLDWYEAVDVAAWEAGLTYPGWFEKWSIRSGLAEAKDFPSASL